MCPLTSYSHMICMGISYKTRQVCIDFFFLCFVFFNNKNSTKKKREKKMSTAQKEKMKYACRIGRVGEVEQVLKEAPSLLNASLDEVFFFWFFVFCFFFCFLFFVFCFLFFVGSCVVMFSIFDFIS